MSRAPLFETQGMVLRSTRQVLVHHTAGCFTCGAAVDARNAQAWAHNHVRHHPGHEVELTLGYNVGRAKG